ncbi:MAG: transcriptional regulator [Candidatus Bathyarchaeia archaeon]|nr:transcriptional regulator [Candidatus Bathyarchaeota archaeon]
MAKKNLGDRKILDIIRNAGDQGILQSELWKMVNADSREGSRTMLRLEKRGLILRRRELYEGRWTYRVKAKHKFTTVDSIINVPCAFCGVESRCSEAGVITPNKCRELTSWLREMADQTVN